MTPEEKAKLTKARNYYKANYGAATQTTTGEVYAGGKACCPYGVVRGDGSEDRRADRFRHAES